MTSKLKTDIILGLITATLITLISMAGDGPYTTKDILISIGLGLLTWFITVFIIRRVFRGFINSKTFAASTKIEMLPDEKLIFDAPANHFKGVEALGGRLYLTDKRLVFKSHRLNIQNHELAILLPEIKLADRYKARGLNNYGLSIHTADFTEKFVVDKIDEWISRITTKPIDQITHL